MVLKEFISGLDKRFHRFLIEEGRWLGGSFSVVFLLEDKSRITYRPEIFNMLPQDMKAEILLCLQKIG